MPKYTYDPRELEQRGIIADFAATPQGEAIAPARLAPAQDAAHVRRARELSDAELTNHALVCFRHCEARYRAMTERTVTACRQTSFTCAALQVALERGLELGDGEG